jgi:hypothetical protein
MVTNLKSWLRRNPMPTSVRYTTVDGEERILELPTGKARKWQDTAEALDACDAVRIECLNAKGEVLRVTKRDENEVTTEAAAQAKQELNKAKETAALALVLDSQGRRISEAYAAGADAASRGQDNLVQVVNILTTQWSATMQSLHNVSMNLAKLARQAGGAEGEEDDGMGAQMQQLLGIAAMKMMGMNGAPPVDDPPAKKGK